MMFIIKPPPTPPRGREKIFQLTIVISFIA
jgi:hypothetical protein